MPLSSPSDGDALQELTQLLTAAHAETKINRARLTRSTLYDPRYHIAVIACAIRKHGHGPHRRSPASC